MIVKNSNKHPSTHKDSQDFHKLPTFWRFVISDKRSHCFCVGWLLSVNGLKTNEGRTLQNCDNCNGIYFTLFWLFSNSCTGSASNLAIWKSLIESHKSNKAFDRCKHIKSTGLYHQIYKLHQNHQKQYWLWKVIRTFPIVTRNHQIMFYQTAH